MSGLPDNTDIRQITEDLSGLVICPDCERQLKLVREIKKA